MYIKALIEEVNAQRHSGAQSATAVRLSIVKHHSKSFSKLGQGQLAALSQRASAYNYKGIDIWRTGDHMLLPGWSCSGPDSRRTAKVA